MHRLTKKQPATQAHSTNQHSNHFYNTNPQSKPGHVYSKFTWGNKKSLWEAPAAAGLDVRAELLKYYG